MNLFKNSVLVLMYHHINKNKGNLVTISPENFDRQISYIATKGYQTVFMTDIVDYITGKKDIPPKTIAITFDDGFLDNWVYAYPILKKYRVKATIFTVTSWISEQEGCRPNLDSSPSGNPLPKIPSHSDSKKLIREEKNEKAMMSWDELESMQKSGIIDIQSHTALHDDMDTVNKDSLKINLNMSKEMIEKKLKKNCDFLAWPRGKYNDNALQLAKEAGYAGIVTTERGINDRKTDPFAIKRIVVKKGDIRWFRSRLFIYSHTLLGKIYSKTHQ